MADDVAIKWLYPPNYDQEHLSHKATGIGRYTVQFTGKSDGTGEDMAVKVRRTDLLSTANAVPSELIIEKIDYDVTGMAVTLEFSGNDVDDDIAYLDNSAGCLDFSPQGNRINGVNTHDDPEWGNILLTSNEGQMGVSDIEEFDPPAYGDTYNIIMTFRAKE